MARIDIVLKKSSSSQTAGSPPRLRFGPVKSATIILLTGILLVGLLFAAFVVGSVIAAVIMASLVVSIVVLVIRLIFGLSRRP
jgi:hypothetical protein